MPHSKDKIKKNFDRASVTYDHMSWVQQECACHLSQMIEDHFPDFNPSVVLELGAGTGFMTSLLLQKYPQSQYYFNDIAPQMMEKAQEKLKDYKNIVYILKDMEEIAYESYPSALSIANLSLQWTNNPQTLIQKIYKNTSLFAFTYPLPETFQEWGRMFKNLALPQSTYLYDTLDQWLCFLKNLHPHRSVHEVKKFTLKFENAQEFMRYLQQLGVHQSPLPFSLSFRDLKKVITTYTMPFEVTYHVLCVVMEQKL